MHPFAFVTTTHLPIVPVRCAVPDRRQLIATRSADADPPTRATCPAKPLAALAATTPMKNVPPNITYNTPDKSR